MNNNSNKNPFEQEESVNIFGEIKQMYFPFWPLFLLTISISLICAFFYIKYQTPIYQANATLILKDEESGTETVLKALDVSAPKKNVKNEIEILKSQKIMDQVVIEMGLYAQIYIPGRVHNALTYASCPVSFISLDPKNIKPAANFIKFIYMPKEKVVSFEGKKYPLEIPVITHYGKFRINYNHLLDAQNNSQYLLILQKVNAVSKGLISNLSINTTSNQSTILNLAFTDPSPTRAEDILNNLIKTYNQETINEKNLLSKNTLDFIEERLAKVTLELSNIEGDIVDYKTEKGIVDISTEGTAYLSSVQNNDQQLAEIMIQLDVLNQIENYVVNKNDQAGTVPAGISDPLLSQLLTKLYEAELQLDKLRKTGAENSPAIIAIKSQIAQIKPGLLENIRNLRQNLKLRQSKVQGESNKYSSMLRTIPKKERDLLDIGRQQTIKNSIYTFLLQKREETALSYASAVADSRLVNAAESYWLPVRPLKTSIYIFALFIGLLSAIAIVLLKEKLTSVIVFRSDIEKATKSVILAEILFDNSKNIPAITEGNRTPIAEQFRSLRTSLSFVGSSTNKKTILLTSSISGDGKSYIAINLAASLALSNKKVALLELDLRKPRISSMLNVNKEPGITNFLVGQIKSDKIIKKVDNFENLFLLPAGNIPPNPQELIINGKLDELIDDLKLEFDYVLIDSPPIGLVSDARLLNKYADISLYIMRHKHTPRKYLKFFNQLFINKELNNLYLVFNGLKSRGIFGTENLVKGGYGNGYGNGYGYGYGEEPTTDKKPKNKLKSKSLFKKNTP